MIREFSAGGIVFRKSKDKIEWLVCQHSQHRGWVFPKGLIGDHVKGEKSEETAVREVQEETGVVGKIIVKLRTPATYWYVWEEKKRLKTVYYFLMEYLSGDIKNHDHEMSAVLWLPTEEVEKKLTYESDKQAFKEALKLAADLTN